METQTTPETRVNVKFTVSEREQVAFMMCVTGYREISKCVDITGMDEIIFDGPYDTYLDLLCKVECAGISEFFVD